MDLTVPDDFATALQTLELALKYDPANRDIKEAHAHALDQARKKAMEVQNRVERLERRAYH